MSENILLTLLTEKQELDERKTDNMKIGSFNIFYKPIEKATFNSKLFGSDYPELKEQYTETKTSLYFSIKG